MRLFLAKGRCSCVDWSFVSKAIFTVELKERREAKLIRRG
jgi:hypothetical protein